MMLRLLLWPFALIYGVVVAIRNFLFDVGLLRSKKFDIPVIVVGNLSVGGTGKSPHVEYLIKLLKDHYRVFVISRGYGRKTKGFRMVRSQSSVEEVGDEPLQIKKKFPGTFMAVSESRVNGIKNMMTHKPDVFILDDAYQHRYVKPSLNILLTDSSKLYSDDYILPSGRLREWKSGSKRADIIIVTKCPPELSQEEQAEIVQKLKPNPTQQLYFSAFQYSSLVPVNESESITPTQYKNLKVLMLTGIANPAPMQKYLESHFSEVVVAAFPDHHYFTTSDISNIEGKFNNIASPAIVVTTEKDITRLENRLNLPLYILPVEVDINNKSQFDQYIINHVRENKRNS